MNRERAMDALSGALLSFLVALVATDLGAVGIVRWPVAPTLVLSVLVGAAIGAFRWHRWLLIPAALAVAAFLLVAASSLMPRLAGSWVRSDPVTGDHDAIVVLASSLTADTIMEATATSRFVTGLDLLRRGAAPILLSTTTETPYGQGMLSSIPDQQRLVRIAQAESQWVRLPLVYTTRDEADQAAKHLLPDRRRILLVTSPMHTRRACALFEMRGFRVTCVPARERDNDRWRPQSAHDRLASFKHYLYERLGWWYYRRKGWISSRRWTGPDAEPSRPTPPRSTRTSRRVHRGVALDIMYSFSPPATPLPAFHIYI